MNRNLMIISASIAVLFSSCKYPEAYVPLMKNREPKVFGMEIILPVHTIHEQETVRAEAYVILADGKKHAVTEVLWESLDAEIVSVDQTGAVTGRSPGRGRIRATLDVKAAVAELDVERHIDYNRIMISEVFYDATGSDDGKEFIELYNDNDYPCDVSGMQVKDGAIGSKPFVFPEGSSINPRSYVVVASSSDRFFELFGAEPDYGYFSFTLNNSGETVFFMKNDGTVIDVVFIMGGADDFPSDETWGSAGLPAAPAGDSVERINTDDTGTWHDWASGAPSPGS
ncbi:MAG: hypothetical protein A2176_13335 [Spirochaetes bacterium RBG_13_51_14]|nr:MAG: hypothetical protein A2176_13335 [Spirochaetes bacterium RBG_13_51_14]